VSAKLSSRRIEQEMAPCSIRQDRASVHTAAGLTDAADFLDLFRRTFARRKHGADTG